MVPVASLLNPLATSFDRLREPPDSLSPEATSPCSPALQPFKKQKMSKAAASFVKGKPRGEVNYPPFEVQDEAIAAEYNKYQVQPIGHISDYPKRIPYNSEKKTFQQKTGRDGFEVYQYTFRMPGDERNKDAHCVMWDYNIGLVRITSFFKSLKHTKTMPAKVMSANPGLRDVSHSITGGSISAQGYWLPFDAAKSVAARFCWEIRYVLVPVFGPDFIGMCFEPGHPNFLQLAVDRDIVGRCKEGANAMHAQSGQSSAASSPRTPYDFASLPLWPPPQAARPKARQPMDIESGYGTDTERSEYCPGTPSSATSMGWTPVNTPKAPNLENFRFPPPNVTSTPWVISSPGNSPKAKLSKRLRPRDEVSDEETSSNQSSTKASVSSKRRKISPVSASDVVPEISAAYTLIQMSMADATLGEKNGGRRRRASA